VFGIVWAESTQLVAYEVQWSLEGEAQAACRVVERQKEMHDFETMDA